MNIKRTKLSKFIYNQFFRKKKSSGESGYLEPGSTLEGSGNKQNVAQTTSPRTAAGTKRSSAAPRRKAAPAPVKKYDLSHLREQVTETEYIANLRLGRRWIFPQLVRMGFVKNPSGDRVFDIDIFMKNFRSLYRSGSGFSPVMGVEQRRKVWNLMKRNYAAIARSNGSDVRARWWTKELFIDMLEWDEHITGKRTRGLNVEECSKVRALAPNLENYEQISAAIDWYDINRMRRRDGGSALPDSFVDAYLADGAYHSMMTMVKVYDLRLKNDSGEDLSRDESVAEIERQAASCSGKELLKYCKEKFFDSGIFQIERYL